MKVLVTGATGFIGGNLVRALVARDYDVRALVRPSSGTLTLDGTGIERCPGDVRDRESVARALKDCQGVFHCAALYSFWERDPRRIYDTNVGGTRTVLEEALKAGVSRAVYTSTVSTVGIPKGGQGNEELEPDEKELVGHYKRSKYLAEKEALRIAREGLPVVVVNPTAPVGPWDVKPTPTGGVLRDFLRGRLPAYINTGMNLVDVDDVAQGHMLALEKGRPGERYLLGNKNMTLRSVLKICEELTGKKAPRLRVPIGLVIALGMVDRVIEGNVLRRRPMIPLEGVRVAKKPMFVSCAKAIRELGLPQSPVEGAVERALAWFKEYGYA